ncbi:MAG: hypothetical protein EVA36_03165 [Flavobacteriales bacterium]|nr:MAG: hypothetical protein CBC56_001690 [Flavobacteriales bacterium TMED96]RZP11486.1 MAG: hypothetical protein EVA36_03165 [Flavobacteriales bacterium]
MYELEQNYFSLLTTRAELKSVVDVTDSILSNWSYLNSEKIKNYYFQNQYALRDDMKTILASRPYFNSKQMYFNSLINSGLILKIENEELRNDLEEIYDVLTFKYDYGSANSEKITAWFNSKMIQNKTMNQEKVFNENYDFELYKYLSDRRRTEVGRLYGIENTTEKLKKVIEKVKREGLF